MKNTLKAALVCSLVLSAFTLSVRQSSAQQSANPYSRYNPFELPVDVDWRMRSEQRDLFTFSAPQSKDLNQNLNRFRVGFGWKEDKNWNLYAQPQIASIYVSGLNSGNTQTAAGFHQGYAEYLTGGDRLRMGRQELSFGEGRLICAAAWGALGVSFDAVRFTANTPHSTVDLFLAQPGLVASRGSHPTLTGLYSTLRQDKTHSEDFYLLYKAAHAAGNSQDIWTLGTRPHIALSKALDATFENAYQFGSSNGGAMSAWAYSANLAYTFAGPVKPRLYLERNFASGGDAGNPKAVHTFDQLFGGYHPRLGIADYVGWRNMQSWRLGTKFDVAPQWTVGADCFLFQLASAKDAWYGALGNPTLGATGKALVDPTGAAGRDLGRELDFNLDYRVTPHTTWSIGYGRFMPGSFVRAVNGGHADSSQWLYIQPTYHF